MCLECEQGLDPGKTYEGGSAHGTDACVWNVSKGWTQVKQITVGSPRDGRMCLECEQGLDPGKTVSSCDGRMCLECEQGLDTGKTSDSGPAHWTDICDWSVSKVWTQIKHMTVGQLTLQTQFSGV
jgi:hypothetical protein